MKTDSPSPDARRFSAALREWFRGQARVLPWRTQRSPYRTLVSEFMLQQTQVATVIPYFERWMTRFPDIQTLAKADEATVLKHWEGLGYYSRARNLHALARELAALPAWPETPEQWLSYRGIGPYTAAAVASIGFNQSAAVVDGNVVRILTRIYADNTLYPDGSRAVKALQSQAETLLSPKHPGEHNEALMELGATVCHRRKPLCLLCPVKSFCRAAQLGNPENFPQIASRKRESVTVYRRWHLHPQKGLLLEKADSNSRRLADVYELPRLEKLPAKPRELARHKRGIGNQDITEIILASPARKLTRQQDYIPVDQLDQITLSGPHKRWIKHLL